MRESSAATSTPQLEKEKEKQENREAVKTPLGLAIRSGAGHPQLTARDRICSGQEAV